MELNMIFLTGTNMKSYVLHPNPTSCLVSSCAQVCLDQMPKRAVFVTCREDVCICYVTHTLPEDHAFVDWVIFAVFVIVILLFLGIMSFLSKNKDAPQK